MKNLKFVFAEGGNIGDVVAGLKNGLDKTPTLTVVFSSTNIPNSQEEVVDAIKNELGGEVWGNSTAGEISSTGFHKNSIVALSIQAPKTVFSVNTAYAPIGDDPENSGAEAVREAFSTMQAQMELYFIRSQNVDPLSALRSLPYNMLISIDGLSGKEERVLSGIASATLNKIQAAGGSAGDDLKFKETYVYSKHGAHTKAVSIAALYTTLKTGVGIKIGFRPPDDPSKFGVVTENGQTPRIVRKINNRPAVEVYMNWLGVSSIEDANSKFAEHPFGTIEPSSKIWKVRSPARILGDGSMLFYSDVPVGTGLTLFSSTPDMHVNAMVEAVKEAIRRAGNPSKIGAVLLFDCILRDILSDIYRTKEREIAEIKKIVGEDTPIIGFSTYGETGNTDLIPLWHHNQTITAMVIGEELA